MSNFCLFVWFIIARHWREILTLCQRLYFCKSTQIKQSHSLMSTSYNILWNIFIYSVRPFVKSVQSNPSISVKQKKEKKKNFSYTLNICWLYGCCAMSLWMNDTRLQMNEKPTVCRNEDVDRWKNEDEWMEFQGYPAPWHKLPAYSRVHTERLHE